MADQTGGSSGTSDSSVPTTRRPAKKTAPARPKRLRDESSVVHTQTDESLSDTSQSGESRTGETQTDTSQSDDVRPKESQDEQTSGPSRPGAAPGERVSLTTLQRGVEHRQRATGVDLLQRALGMATSGYPDDDLDAALDEYRREVHLDGAGVDRALLERLGFDVVI